MSSVRRLGCTQTLLLLKLTHRCRAPHQQLPALLFIFSLARSCRLARRKATCLCDGTLHSGWRKESSRSWRNESRISGDKRRFWAVTVPSIYDGQRKHHPIVVEALIGRPRSPAACRVAGMVIKDKLAIDRSISSDIRPLLLRPSYPGTLVYSLRCA